MFLFRIREVLRAPRSKKCSSTLIGKKSSNALLVVSLILSVLHLGQTYAGVAITDIALVSMYFLISLIALSLKYKTRSLEVL